jgi:hypothetical protein
METVDTRTRTSYVKLQLIVRSRSTRMGMKAKSCLFKSKCYVRDGQALSSNCRPGAHRTTTASVHSANRTRQTHESPASLLSTRSLQVRLQTWCPPKIRCTISIPVDPLGHRVSASITGTSRGLSSVVYIPHLRSIRRRKKSIHG